MPTYQLCGGKLNKKVLHCTDKQLIVKRNNTAMASRRY
jgi:hypothetical protein